jgi:hypothetical protein
MVCSDRFNMGGQHADEIVFSTADERRLAVVSIALDRFLDRCEDTLRHTDHSIRCCLRSHFPGRSYKSPFELPSRNSTRTRYHSLWKRMVFFCSYQREGRKRRAQINITCSFMTCNQQNLNILAQTTLTSDPAQQRGVCKQVKQTYNVRRS